MAVPIVDLEQDPADAAATIDEALRTVGFDIPLWYNAETWVAYYDYYRHPDPLPPLDVGHLDFWWFDAEAYEDLKAQGAL